MEVDIYGHGQVTIDSWEDFDRFVNEEAAHWTWATDYSGKSGAAEVTKSINTGFMQLRRQGAQARSNNPNLSSAASLLRNTFKQGGTLVHHEAPDALRAQDARVISDEAALFALGFLRGIVSLGAAKTIDDLRGALWVVLPGVDDTTRLADVLKRERENARQTVRRLADEAEEGEKLRNEEVRQLRAEARRFGFRFVRRYVRRVHEATHFWTTTLSASNDDIRATEAAFKELMKLKAPVQYWEGKADKHKDAELWASVRLWIYFPLALVLVVGLFGAVGWYLLEEPDGGHPSGLYFIASAGLASSAALLFWIGRLLTKLYLSEHHLRRDAEERAVMTTTYLALTAENAASDDDRQIVLNALFRGTSDGIVKEDGGFDPSLAALISRLGTR